MADGDDVGHLVLLLIAGISAWIFRGIPWWLWLIIYVFSAFAAPTAWKEKALTPVFWLFGSMGFAGATVLMYRLGLRFLVSSQPWMIFKGLGILAPMLALTCVSGLARMMYLHSRGTSDSNSGDKVNGTTAR